MPDSRQHGKTVRGCKLDILDNWDPVKPRGALRNPKESQPRGRGKQRVALCEEKAAAVSGACDLRQEKAVSQIEQTIRVHTRFGEGATTWLGA